MSLRTNLRYTILSIALLCVGAEAKEPDESIIPDKSFKTCTNFHLIDAVNLSQDIYEICCNSPNIFFQRNRPSFPVCHANLIVKGKYPQGQDNQRQKRNKNSDLAHSFWFRKTTNLSPRQRTSANKASAAIMSGGCMFPISTPTLGYVYGNCSGLYHANSSDICLGACGPLEPHRCENRERQLSDGIRGDETGDDNIMPM
ncbi:hypothetical protein CHS0354_015251 [Potamilus streckersoni]|uniref:Uncharacterized protein n=1 Tax=Potamilus streckersoni TaxID=2493646 RepID=A0AAE0RRW2_9BIVA|nr:hypothetical protein CHS0354_015251 [Potamilus streckersoni]